jgi:hypothetical protein
MHAHRNERTSADHQTVAQIDPICTPGLVIAEGP